MNRIESFIKFQDKFVSIKEFSGVLTNPEYPEGSILLVLEGKTLISKDMWDYLDQLWFCIIEGVEHVLQRKHYMGYFPGQPIEIIFKDLNDVYVEVRIGENHVVIKKDAFVRDIIIAAMTFFRFYLPLSDHPESEPSVMQRLEGILKIVQFSR